MDVESKKAGLDATLALSERMRVLRVPAGAVFGINGSTGCIVPTSNNHGNTPVKVSIVGGELGVSLVQADSGDIASISNVEIGDYAITIGAFRSVAQYWRGSESCAAYVCSGIVRVYIARRI